MYIHTVNNKNKNKNNNNALYAERVTEMERKPLKMVV